MRHFRMRIGNDRNIRVGCPAPFLRIFLFIQVMGNNVCFIVRFVPERRLPIHISQRINTRLGRFQKLVCDDVTFSVRFNFRLRQIQPICIGNNPRGYENNIRGKGLIFSRRAIADRTTDLPTVFANTFDRLIGINGDARISQGLQNEFRNFRFFTRHKILIMLHQSHVDAQCGKTVCKFGTDRTAA